MPFPQKLSRRSVQLQKENSPYCDVEKLESLFKVVFATEKNKKKEMSISLFLLSFSLSSSAHIWTNPTHTDTHTQSYKHWWGPLPIASKAAEKAHASHGGEVMQMLCPQRPQELWKDLCKYLMHSCDLRFMEMKTTIEKPMPHSFLLLPFLL